MNKTAIIIPSRLDAQRLPNKPLKLINNKEMILHVYEAALKSNAEEVFVATPDQRILDLVKKFGGNCILTTGNHETGTDRVFEVFKKFLNGNPNIVINLQGDMPNIHPDTINNLINYMKKGECEIGTLASKLSSNSELADENVVKVLVKEKMEPGVFAKALDFSTYSSYIEIISFKFFSMLPLLRPPASIKILYISGRAPSLTCAIAQ